MSVDDLFSNDGILGRRHLTVDLNGTKADVLKDFRKWLDYSQNQFERNEQKQLVNKIKIRTWLDDRILAYLDLLIWCKISNIEVGANKDLPEEKLIEWINVRTSYDINNTKKEVNKLRDRIMTFNTIIRLYKYAYGNISIQQIKRIVRLLEKKHSFNLKSLQD